MNNASNWPSLMKHALAIYICYGICSNPCRGRGEEYYIMARDSLQQASCFKGLNTRPSFLSVNKM